ncbi:MAG: thiamine pyrophosphate-dependent enzyme [Candidatus Methylomirabilia bacterium]
MKESEERDSYLGERPFPYCKGCGHGLVVRRLNEALMRLKLDPGEVVLTSDIGCVGLVDHLFPSVHTVHTIHGRSTAVAAGAVLADTLLGQAQMKNIVMIGDGGATIGLLHLTQAALMNVDLTILLHNNMLYGMTGGQHSALTPAGFITTTTLSGNWVPPLDMEQLLMACQGGFFARQLATDPALADVIVEAIRYPGFALVEVLELCTGYGVPLNEMDGKSLRRMAEANGRQLGLRIRRTDRRPFHELYRERFPAAASQGEAEGAEARPAPTFPHRLSRPMGIVIAGSAGERVQTAAAILCQAALLSDLCCTQKNDYPTTVGSGFSLSEAVLSPEAILSTGIERPDAIVIASLDGLREVRSRGDLQRLTSPGMVIADESVAAELPGDRTLSLPLRQALSPKIAAWGGVTALIQQTGILDKETLLEALEIIVGREAAAFRQAVETAWG